VEPLRGLVLPNRPFDFAQDGEAAQKALIKDNQAPQCQFGKRDFYRTVLFADWNFLLGSIIGRNRRLPGDICDCGFFKADFNLCQRIEAFAVLIIIAVQNVQDNLPGIGLASCRAEYVFRGVQLV